MPGFKELNVKDFNEIKSLNKPAEVVVNVMSAFFSVFGKQLNWESVRIELKQPNDVLK